MHCAFCDWDETSGACCNASSERGFLCTRHDGHRGDHVACDTEDHSIDVWHNTAEPKQLTDTDRLDFLLQFLHCDDAGDETVCLELIPDYERMQAALPVDPDRHHAVGSWMDGWTCDKRAVIDAAIERSRR